MGIAKTYSVKHMVKLGLVVLVLLQTSCSMKTKTNEDGNSIAPNTYQLVEILASTDSFPGGLPEIVFGDSGELTGFTGCNRFFGNYTTMKKQLSLKAIGMTKMFCFNVGEPAFLHVLEQTTGFEQKDTLLYLKAGEKKIAIFKLK